MDISLFLTLIPAVILFVYGIENFSKEIQFAAGTHFSKVIKWATKNNWRSTIFGSIVTALIQSSAATTIIAMGLVNSGTITFAQSIGIIFGANIGTTITSQLVALNLTTYAPILIVFGFILSLLKTKYKVFGKPLFYFGMVFFALNLVSLSVSPLQSDPQIMGLFALASILPIGILAGFIITNIFQSSSVTTGLVVVFAQSGLIGLNEAIPIILGANIGTTVLTLLISSRMDVFAKRAALAHFLFNIIGVAMFIPLISLLIIAVQIIGGGTAQQVANAHLIFNVVATVVLLIFINSFRNLIEKIIPTQDKEIILSAKALEGIEKKTIHEIFSSITEEFKNNMDSVISIFDENKKLLYSSNGDTKRIEKLNTFVEYIHSESKRVIIKIAKRKLLRKDSQKIISLSRSLRISEELAKMGQKIGEAIIYAKENQNDFASESTHRLDECFSILISNLVIIKSSYPVFDSKTIVALKVNEQSLRTKLAQSYEEYFSRLSKGKANSGSIFAEVLDRIQDTNTKLSDIRRIN